MVKKAVEAEEPAVPEKKPGRTGRPPLTPVQKAERDAKKRGDTRDSVRIYLTSLQFAYLNEYHAQGGHLPEETIRHAIDFYFDWLIKTERYEPTVTPKSARLAWAARMKVVNTYNALIEKETGGDPDIDVSDDYPPPEGIEGKDIIR